MITSDDMKGLIITLFLLIGFGSFVLWNANRPIGGAGSVLFNIAKGDSVQRISERLQDAHLIRSAKFFQLTVWSRGHRGDFKTGSFEISPRLTTRDLELQLAGAKPVSNEVEFTAIEGWTLDDIATALEKQRLTTKAAFAAQAGISAVQAAKLPDWAASFPVLSDKPALASLEGYLFPDTYRVYADGNVSQVIRRMLANTEAKFTPAMREQAQAHDRTVFQILTMASVLEREVRSDADRAMVADLFWRRVDSGRGMEADSTVNYCTGKSLASVSYADTKINCPWNTYKYKGLPVGPIGNPGLSTIKAALSPTPNTYWYFLTDKDGNVHYAKTLDEHNANKRKYLK